MYLTKNVKREFLDEKFYVVFVSVISRYTDGNVGGWCKWSKNILHFLSKKFADIKIMFTFALAKRKLSKHKRWCHSSVGRAKD